MEHCQQTLCQLGHVPNTLIYWATESNKVPPDITGVNQNGVRCWGSGSPSPPPCPPWGIYQNLIDMVTNLPLKLVTSGN